MKRTYSPVYKRSGGIAAGRQKRRYAFATITVLFIMTLLVIAALVLIGTALFHVRGSARGQNKMNALMLAEAGVDDTIGVMQQGNISYSGTGSGSPVTLYEDPGTNSRPFGTFTTQVTTPTSDSTKRVIRSDGRASNGASTTVYALVDIVTRPLGSFGAVVASGNDNVTGTAVVTTVDGTTLGTPLGTTASPAHVADVLANGNVSMGGNSTVDGQLIAAGTVSGQAYYPSVSGAPPYPFPSATTTALWKTNWITQAQAGGTTSTIKMTGGKNKSATITADQYINGDITLNSGETLTLKAPNSWSGAAPVVYVSGSITLTAQSTLINGVTLIVGGTFTQQGQSVYQIDKTVTPTPTLVVYGTGYSSSSTVISLTGGSTDISQGVVYAVNGSISVAGGSTFVGALVAGNGNVSISGNYTHLYPNNMSSAVRFDWGATVTGVTEP